MHPPEVKDDCTVTFLFKVLDARTVALTGGPILLAIGKGNTPISLIRALRGCGRPTVGPLKPKIQWKRPAIYGVAVVRPEQYATGLSDQPGYSSVVVHEEEPAMTTRSLSLTGA